ncbi:hypothetical protein [Eoetvoesiella caeni]|nr:hypothetical protein [Eoetvoesiella caeni]MCI2807799.1 hypothetical protein [Eoetvoesiella caeni]
MGQSVFHDVDLESFVDELRTKGVAFGLRLPAGILEELTLFAQNNPCYAYRRTEAGFRFNEHKLAENSLQKPILLAQYFNTAVQCNAVKQLINDPVLQWIAATYLQSVPTFVGANMWWTFPVKASEQDRSEHAHLFHRDVDDYKFFKFFFYLTDVNPGEGAHVCVVASHENPPRIKASDKWTFRRYSDEEIDGFYAAKDIVEICGEAGTGFAENTLCIHKGRTPIAKERLLLQLQYSLFDYGVTNDIRDAAQLQMLV